MRLQIDKHILCHQLINRIAAVQHETNIESEAFFWRYDIHPSSTPLFDILFLDRVTPAMAVVIPLAKPTYLGSAKAWRIVKVLNHLPIRRTSQIISKNWDFLMNKSLERNNEISHLWRNVAASRAWKNGTMAHLPQICIRRLPNGLNFWNFTAKTWAKRSITNNQQAPPQIKAIFGVGFNEPRFASWRFRFADLCDKFPVGNQESNRKR